MRLSKYLVFRIGLSAIISLLVVFAWQGNFFRRLELNSLDLLFRLRSHPQVNTCINIIEITDEDVSKIGVWSWPRSWQAAMARALNGMGAKYIYFDILFSEPSDEKGDSDFEEAIRLNKNIYLPYAFQGQLLHSQKGVFPINRFTGELKGNGSINIYPDEDGVIRRIPLVFRLPDKDYYHIALQIAADYLGEPAQNIKLPLDNENSLLLNWYGRWEKTFRHYGFLRVLAAYKDFLDNKPSEINPEDFKNSICLVTVTATGIRDVKPVPMQTEYPGAGVIATGISNIINKDFIYFLPGWINIIFIFLLALVPALLRFREGPLPKTIIVMASAALYCAAAFYLFSKNMVLDLLAPLFALFISYFCFATYNFIRAAIEKKIFYQKAVTDSLTGLYNIGYFKLLLDTEIALNKAGPKKEISLIMLDVDHFKKFNDTWGHESGNLALREIATVIKNSLRASDIAARYGGEEMIVFLRSCPFGDAMHVAEKIRKNIEDFEIKDEKKTYKVTASLGVASLSPEDSSDTLIKRADLGLYQAKESGRNKTCAAQNDPAAA